MTVVSGVAILLYFGSFLAPLLLGVAAALLDHDRAPQYAVASVLGVGLVNAYFSVPMTEATALGLLVNPGAVLLVPATHVLVLDRRNHHHAGRVLLAYAPPLLLVAASIWSILAG